MLRCAARGSDWTASRSSSEFKKLLFSNFEAIAKDKKFTGSHPNLVRSTVESRWSSTLVEYRGRVVERCSSHSDLRSFTGFEKIRDATKIHCEYSEEYPEKWMEGLVIEGRSEQLLTQVSAA